MDIKETCEVLNGQVLQVYTDGACLPNPGSGGWAWACRDGTHKSGGERNTTNQRMELMGVISALEDHPDQPIHIFSDSMYVINGATDWSRTWIRNGWRNSKDKPVANRELWERLLAAMKGREVQFSWVKGHSGDEMNDRVDDLAHRATGLDDAAIQHYKKLFHGSPKKIHAAHTTN